MAFSLRMRAASKAALFHFLGSLLVAAMAAAVVFWLWYPHPYGQLSGGRHLFLIIVAVDVVCGPLLTLVLYNPKKPRLELVTDMSLVILIQLAALAYGMYTAYQARPLFLVHEVDRFRVITLPDYGDEDVSPALAALHPSIQPGWLGGPVTVGIRSPQDNRERQGILFDSVFGGRDYSQRPEFYIPYDQAYRVTALARSRPLKSFIGHYPSQVAPAERLLAKTQLKPDQVRFLPVIHKQDWVALLDPEARIVGFLPGDGFAVEVKPD